MAGKLKIKYCIWDVGGVIYPYTLKFVNEFMKSRTEDMAAFNENNAPSVSTMMPLCSER